MTDTQESVEQRIEEDSRLWIPDWVKQEAPTDGAEEPDGAAAELSVQRREDFAPHPHFLLEEIREHGVHLEPEIAQAREEAGVGRLTYSQMYPTRFFFTDAVSRSIRRVQAQFPWLTYCNTYVQHPPVFEHRYEHVSVDYWGGGMRDGRYVGYRGKSLNSVDGLSPAALFNAIFSDPRLPNIYWIIHRGRMWVRGSGWQGSPGGPAGSDARHDHHIHVTYL